LLTESASRAPNSDDGHEEADIPEEAIEAMLQAEAREEESVLNSEPKLTAEFPVEIGREELARLRGWHDEHEPIEKDYTPGPPESCGLRRTNIALESGQIEKAFGYGGGKRYISLHRSPELNKLFVCDGIGRFSLSQAVDTWNQFLNHAMVKPHLQHWGESEGRTVPIDFSGRIDTLPDSPIFASEQGARDMETDLKTNCLLYDRGPQRALCRKLGFRPALSLPRGRPA
jgi:hypothetical protein